MDPVTGLFKKIAVEQLSNVLSDFIDGLDESSFNTHSDSVTLTSLRLKENDLPGVGLRVKGGYINSLTLRVPWKRLKKESVVVTVDDVFVVLGARAVTAADRDFAWNQCQSNKRAKLDIDEEVEEKGYFQRILETIKQNLRIDVTNVKVVMELDDWEHADSPYHSNVPTFRIRLTVEQIKLETCKVDGRDWVPAFVDESKLAAEHQSKKQIMVKNVTIRMCDKPAERHLRVNEHSEVGRDDVQDIYGREVLRELDLRLRLKLRQSNEEADRRDVTMPEVAGHLEASECHLVLNKFQYSTLMGVKLQDLWRPDELRKLVHPTIGGALASQPLARPRRGHSAAQWWRFAISTVMHSAAVMHRQTSGRISWKYFCDLVVFGRPYMKAWKRKLRKFELTEADKQTIRLAEGYRAEDLLGGNKHWVPGRLCTSDVLYFRELALAEKDAEDERDGNRREQALAALKGFAASKPKEIKVKDATQKAKSRFSGLRARAQQTIEAAQEKAQEMADKAQEFALIGVEEDVADDEITEFVWIDKTEVGNESSRIAISEVKIGLRYYAEDDKRVVKTADGDPPRVTRPRPPPEELASLLSGQGQRGSRGSLPDPEPEPEPSPVPAPADAMPAAGGILPGIPSPRDKGPAPLTQAERVALYKKKGILNDGEENELSSLALTPEYVRIEMMFELGRFSLRLLGPEQETSPTRGRSPEPTVFAGLNIAGLSLRALFRPESIKLRGRILNDLSVEARPAMSAGEGTKLLALKKSAGSRGKENLVQFDFDTLTHQTEVSARLVVAVATITVQAVPAPIADMAEFFMPEEHTDDDGRAGSATAGRSKREKTKRIWSKAKTISKKLGAGKRRSSTVVAATQRKSYVELSVKTKALELVVPEDSGNSGGAFHLTVSKVELDSTDHALAHPGMFDRSCHAVKAAVKANSRAVETARSKKWCQNVTVQLCDASISYAHEPITEESERVCIVSPFSVTGHFALAQQPGPMGPPESFLAISILLPSITIDATANCLARLAKLWDSVRPLLPKKKDRKVAVPHPIKEMPYEDLDSFVNLSSRATVRLWVQIGSGAGESATGIVLRTPAANAGKAAAVVVAVPSVGIGFLRCRNERTDSQSHVPPMSDSASSATDTYLEITVETASVSFVDEAEEAVGPAVISITPASGSGARVEFASQLGWQPGAEDAYAKWPISISEDSERVWQYGDTKFQLVNVQLGNCVGWARVEVVRTLKAITDEVLAYELQWSAAPKRHSSPSHILLNVTAAELAVNCFLDNQMETPEAESASPHACMNLSCIELGLELSREPITSECEREIFVSIGGVRATLSQDGVDLDLVPDVQDEQAKVKFKLGTSTPPAVEEGIPLEVGGILQAEHSHRPLTLEVDIHAIMVWIYPSLIHLLHELLQKAPPSALDHERAKQLAKQQAMRPMKVYVNISDCDVLLSTTDPTMTISTTQLVVGVHLQSFLIPPTSIGMGDDAEAQTFELSIGDEHGGLRIYTGRLSTDGITAKRELLEDVVLALSIERQREGYVVNLESGNISANLDGGEATALLGLLALSKLWSSGDVSPPESGEFLDAEQSSDEDEIVDVLELGGYRAGAPRESSVTPKPRRMRILKGRAEIPCVRLALSTGGNDVTAILVQSLEAEITNDSLEASVFAVALSDCAASEQGLCVVGMGPWADLQEEPTMEAGLRQAKEREGERAMQVNWLYKPMDETSNPLDGDEAGHMIDVEIAQIHVKLTPRFCTRCVDWVATVWEDREEFTEDIAADARPPEAEEGDWVLREDHCIETTVHLGTFGTGHGSSGMKRYNRLFVERPAAGKHTTVILSGGSLSASVDPHARVTGTSALVYVGADVNLVLQDVNVDNFDASLFALGPGATVSGSVNLDGTEIWDSGWAGTKRKGRRRRLRRQRGVRALKATIQADQLQLTSVHSFGSFTFEFGLSVATTIQDHHTRFELEGKRISLLSIGVEETATQLFYMPQAVVMYDTSSDDGRAFVRVDLAPVPIVLSNRIGKAAFWAGNQWLDVAKAATQLGAELAKAESKEVRKKRLEMERQRRHEASMATLITSVQCPEIEVLMLNDTSSLENGGKQLAMRLNIQAISSDSHRLYMPDADNNAGRMHNQGKLEFSLALDVMNPSNAAWEPLCERFPFQLDANRDGPKDVVVDVQIGKKAPPITLLNGTPQHGSVEISLTPAMIGVFQQTADYWVRSLSAAPPLDAAEANFVAARKVTSLGDDVAELCSDLHFQNDLPDLSLQFKCGPAFQLSSDDGDLRTLDAGQQIMLNLRYASESDERYLMMTVEGYSTERFQVERVMSEVISFKPKDMIDGTETHVVVSVVHNVGNLKVISIRSPVFVSNKCTEEISMQLIGAAGETGTLIPPGKGVSIPTSSKSMKIRPSVPGLEAIYGWSSVLWRSPTDIEPQRIVMCDAVPGVGEKPYHYCIERTVAKQPGAKLEGLTIEVFAPLLMLNLLPVQLQYFVYKNAGTGTSLLEGYLEHGAESILYTLPESAYIEFKLAGFKQGKRYKIPGLCDMPVKVELPDYDDNILELQLQADDTRRAGHQLTIWCPYWIINNTGLRLRYAADDTFAYNAFAGPSASDFPGEPFLVSQTKVAVSASAFGGMAAKNPVPPENNCAALNAKGERDYETGWSKAFSTGTVGTAGVFSLSDKAENSWQFDIGTNISLGVGKFRRTKIVSLHAQYTVVNQLTQTILVRQSDADLSRTISVLPDQSAPLYWPHRDRAAHIVMKIDADGHMWSAPVAFESTHNLTLPVFVRNTAHELAEAPPFVIVSKTAPVSTGSGDHEVVKCELVSGQVVQMLGNDGSRVEIQYVGVDGTVETGWIDSASAQGTAVLEPVDTALAGRCFSGNLEKAGEVRTAFKKRFFIFSWPKLQYYESTGGEYKGCIDMRHVTAVQCTNNSPVLNLVTRSRTYVLKAPQKRFQTWKSLLLCALLPAKHDPVELTADLVVNGGSQKLTVAAANPLEPAYMIQNHVDGICVWASQKDATDTWEMMVGPNQSKAWVWPDPVGAKRVNFRIRDTRSGKQDVEIQKDYGLDKIKEHKPLTIGDQELVFISNVRGLSKVTHIYTKMRKPGASRARTARRNSLDLTNGAAPPELKGQIAELGEMKLELKIPQIGISMVGKRLMGSDWQALGLNTDIIYMSVLDLEVKLAQQMNGEQSMEVVADWIQVDNGNRTSPFPVAFRPAPSDGVHKALFQFSVVRCAKEMGPNAFRMIQVLMQEADILVDEELVASLMMFIGEVKFGDDDDAVSSEHAEADFELTITAGDKSKQVVKAETIFCEFLQIHPISLTVTYASSAGIDMGELGVSSFLSNNPLLDILANVDAAPLKLNALMLSDLVTTKDQASELVVKHYKRQGVLELYKLMGTVDLLGNPMGLVTGVASGVVDFFYEPGQALMTNPSELGAALSKGTMSLIGGTIGGSMNTVSKMTGAVGKGLGTLTMDDSYITQRRAVAQAEDAADGLVKGVEHLGSGMFKGVTGIVTNPYKEGKKSGASGFMKGMGKGLVGAVVKPAAGVLDLAADVSSGIKATATGAGAKRALRARPPRAPVYDANAALSPYDVRKALAVELVVKNSLHKTLANQMKEKLLEYVTVNAGAKYFLLTDQRVMVVDPNDAEAGPLSIPLHQVSSSSKGPSGTTLDVLYDDGAKKTKKLSVDLAGAMGENDDEADRKRTHELAMSVLISSAERKRWFMDRDR